MAKNSRRSGEIFDVFISFSERDGATYATALAKALSLGGYRCYLPSLELAAGDRLDVPHRRALEESRLLVFVGTPGAMTSEWVRFEVDSFRRMGGAVLPIVFDMANLAALPVTIQDIQYLREERGTLELGPSEAGLTELLSALRRLLSERSVRSIGSRQSPSSRETRPLNEGKVILVGRGEVGKTSIVNRLTKHGFRGDESKTQGIQISTWSLRCRNDTLRLNIWDFGGQEIMHATHRFFLTEQSLYLLIVNGRGGGEDEDVEYWLKHIETFGGSSPVIVIQNKIGQQPFELNYRGLHSRHAQIRGFVKTDCKDGTGIDELMTKIREALATMPEVRMKFQADWFEVKERLESMREDFMSYDAFQRLCEDSGVAHSERATLSWILHCLGIALNYRDDPRLRETSVLKPEWATKGIYRILNARTVADRLGEMHLADLEILLDRKRYPETKHLFLMELMRKFGLCFPFPEERDRYLIPELLGKEEPSEATRFVESECLNFEYSYAILPEGILPRFIVSSHMLSRGGQRWRSGVILAHEGCQALVRAEAGNRRVVIRIKGGDASTRRRLLAVIRYDFERIHSEFKDRLEVAVKVPLPGYPQCVIDYHKLVAFERSGVAEFPELVGAAIVPVRVTELLNGVDFERSQTQAAAFSSARSVFLSYSHRDETLKDEFEVHLKLLQRQGTITIWHDRKILGGTEWDHEIDRRLNESAIVLLLVSADFIASDYCWDKEIKRAMERHGARESTVIPVILRRCDWEGAPFSKLQALPRDALPVTAWQDRDAAWTDVVKGIRSIVESR